MFYYCINYGSDPNYYDDWFSPDALFSSIEHALKDAFSNLLVCSSKVANILVFSSDTNKLVSKVEYYYENV